MGLNQISILWQLCSDPQRDRSEGYGKYILRLKKGSLTTNVNKKNKNKILVIKTVKDFNVFSKKYMNNSIIIWKNLSKDYGGIEICNISTKINWNKGCIWKYSLITNTFTKKPSVGNKVKIAIKPYKGKTSIGIVKKVLTKKKYHSKGHKVMLTSGIIGRITQIFI